jgi:uncharacterized protein (DUF2236 family)
MSPVAAARRRLGEAIFHRVAGDEGPKRRERIHHTPGPRWFPHGSPVQQVHGDASMFVGGMRAVMLQSLHPLAMQAVADHSGYRGDLWGRLARTSAFLATTTFATADDAEAAVRAVRRIHARVTGTMPDGTPYAADDPHLLRWVHVAELRQALAEFRPELRASEAARDAISWLVRHPDLPAAALPGYRLIVAAATEMLPRWASDELGLRRHPLLEKRLVPVAGEAVTRTIRWAMAPPPELLEAAERSHAG